MAFVRAYAEEIDDYDNLLSASNFVFPYIEEDSLPIILLFDNDVHGAFEGYASIAALRDDEYASTPFVSLLSIGDYAQGGPLCSYSHGLYVAEMLNAAQYDVVTLGNHEFDYGMDKMREITSQIKAKKVLCNLYDVRGDSLLFAPYTILNYGNRRVAYVGAVTPTTQNTDSPQSYVDEDGQVIYSFMADDFYPAVQRAVDAARKQEVDYVVLLSHVGDVDSYPFTSQNLVERTTGIDIVLDGHSHSEVPERWLLNAQGDSVLLASTGSKFQNIGRVVINADGSFQSELIPTRTLMEKDDDVVFVHEALLSTFENAKTFGHCDFQLTGFDPQDGYDRNMQTNLGDLCSDALRVMTGADIGWINAGGMRTNIPMGDISIKELLAVFPFENKICVAEVPGQRILDALEYCVSSYPEDNGSFPQVSGLTYRIHANVPTPVQMDEQQHLVCVRSDTPRRVYDVRFKGRLIDPSRTYTVASIDYILKFNGCGGIFSDFPLVSDDGMIDIQLFENFITSRFNGNIPKRYRQTQNRVKGY